MNVSIHTVQSCLKRNDRGKQFCEELKGGREVERGGEAEGREGGGDTSTSFSIEVRMAIKQSTGEKETHVCCVSAVNDGSKREAEERQSERAAIVSVPAGSQWP